MQRILGTVLTSSLVLTLLLLPGCRSKSKAEPVTSPPPVVEQAPPSTPVSSGDDDFVSRDVDRDVLPSDLSELTRMAHERGWLRDAFFAYDAATLSGEAREALAMSARWLRDNPRYTLLVEGHCDERGTSQYNLALGDRRAQTARDYLVQVGVPASRIRTTSYGEERPFDTGSNESAWARNRRAHLVLVSD